MRRGSYGLVRTSSRRVDPLLAEPLPTSEPYSRFVEDTIIAPVVDSIAAAEELAARLGPMDVTQLPLSARQPLGDELLFHRALELARAARNEPALEAVPAIPEHASKLLIDALT